jgi:hypothetical protein
MKPLAIAFVVVFVVCTTLHAQWTPRGTLANVPVRENCAMTGGDIAVARGGVIWYCRASADQTNARWPGAGHFYYVHEFGHIALASSDERRVDCWAAEQLSRAPNGQDYLRVAVQHFMDRQNEPVNPRYGPMAERARRVASCGHLQSAPSPQPRTQPQNYGRSCCTPYGKCGPFYNQPALPIGSACYCGNGATGRVCN